MGEKLEPFVRHGTAEKPIEVSADEVLNAIADGRDVDVEYAIINGHLEIRKIAEQLERNEEDKPILKGSISIQFSRISGFTGFSSAIFSRSADFSYTTFGAAATFISASFSGLSNFMNANFKGHAVFNSATFGGGDAIFLSAIFNEDAIFEATNFIKSAYFESASFDGDAIFRSASFSRRAHFSYATFNGRTNFVSAIFSASTNFAMVAMEHPANFAGILFRENTTLVGLWNYVLWPLVRPTVRLFTGGKVKPRKTTVTSFWNMNTNVAIDASTNPYLKRYIDDEQWIASWRQRSWWRKVLFVFWELTSHCGRSFGLWLFWSFALAVVFGFLYKGHIDIGSVKNWYTPFYFSVVTFTTLGFGDVTPMDWLGQLWITLEVVCGYLMLGGLISIFANKFARRS